MKFVSAGNERAIVLFLYFESALLAALAGVVRFCCTFWKKKKIQDQGLGSFLEKRVISISFLFSLFFYTITSLPTRCILYQHLQNWTFQRSLQLRKKAFDRIISELKEKGTKEEAGTEVYEKMEDMVRERECIERKLSTTYSLGRDGTDSQSKSLLPLYRGKAKFSSFQGRKERVAIFHTLSDTTSGESSSDGDTGMVEGMDSSDKAKGKAPMEEDTLSDEESVGRGYRSVTEAKTSSKLLISSPGEKETLEVKSLGEGEREVMQRRGSSTWLKRRKTLSSTN